METGKPVGQSQEEWPHCFRIPIDSVRRTASAGIPVPREPASRRPLQHPLFHSHTFPTALPGGDWALIRHAPPCDTQQWLCVAFLSHGKDLCCYKALHRPGPGLLSSFISYYCSFTHSCLSSSLTPRAYPPLKASVHLFSLPRLFFLRSSQEPFLLFKPWLNVICSHGPF